MNVANRKLFANRDARKKLAEMGGILASSPELLGEAMTFANGGEAEVEQYVVIIRGINGGRPIRLRGDTLARLQDLVPEIMQQAFVMDAATAAERGVDVNRLRPGDAFVERQLTPAAPVPTVQEPVDDRSIRDIVREGLASTYDYNPLSGNFTEQSLSELLTTPTNPMVQMVESGLQSLGVEDPNAALIAQVDPSIVAQLSAPPMYDMTKFGRLGDALPDISFRSSDDPTNPMVSLIESGLKSAGVEDPSEALIAPVDPGLVARLSVPPMYDMTKFGRPSAPDPEMTGLEAVELQRASDPRSDEGIRARVAESAQRGMRAGEIANMLGRPLVEILDIGAGLASAGLLEGTAFASDLMSAFQSGIMGNTQAGEFYAGLATDIKDLSDEMYYNEGEVLPRLTAGLDKGLTEAELLEQRRKDIESQSLRNMSDAMLANDPSLFAEGSVSERLPDLPESIIQARKGPGPEVSFMGSAEEPFGAPLGLGSSETIAFTALPEQDVLRSSPSAFPDIDTSTGVPLTLQEAANLSFNERIDAANAGLTNIRTSSDRFPSEDAYRKAQQDEINRILYPGKARKFREEEAQIAKMTGMPEIGSADPKKMQEALDSLLAQVVENPGKVSNQIAANLIKENEDGEEVTILTPEESLALQKELEQNEDASGTSDESGDNTPSVETKDGKTPSVEKIIKMTPAEATDEYYKQLKKRLGLSDKDKARDLSLTMAQFGLAMAAGQSPNALTNIANAANATLAQFKAERKEERALDRELMLAADERAREDEKRREDARERLQRAYIGAGLEPVYGKDGSIISFKILPSKTGTYTPERLRQTLLPIILDLDVAESLGLMDDTGNMIDMNKVNKFLIKAGSLGLDFSDEDNQGPKTVDEFITEARKNPENAKFSDEDLTKYYNEKYGK